MMKAGAFVSFVGVVLLVGLALALAPVIFGVSFGSVPAWAVLPTTNVTIPIH